MIALPTDATPLIIHGHVLDVLRTIPYESIQTCVTSWPYWGQRLYETPPQVWGGDPDHAHVYVPTPARRSRSEDDVGKTSAYGKGANSSYEARGGELCECGAWRGEFGLEPTPEMYVYHGALVSDEVRRVLKKDGTYWLNLASTYATYPSGLTGEKRWKNSWQKGRDNRGAEQSGGFDKRAPGWKHKEMVPIPWMVGMALHEAGWWLRGDVIWQKKNGKHENVRDRPYRAHEYVTMFTKGPDPYYDEAAVRQPYAPDTVREIGIAYRNLSKTTKIGGKDVSLYERAGAQDPSELKRRIIDSMVERGGSMLPDVWLLATGNGEGRHVAVFPETLPELCITASSRPGDLVLDIFSGSGTTNKVARRLGRRSIGIELSEESVTYAKEKSDTSHPALGRWDPATPATRAEAGEGP